MVGLGYFMIVIGVMTYIGIRDLIDTDREYKKISDSSERNYRKENSH